MDPIAPPSPTQAGCAQEEFPPLDTSGVLHPLHPDVAAQLAAPASPPRAIARPGSAAASARLLPTEMPDPANLEGRLVTKRYVCGNGSESTRYRFLGVVTTAEESSETWVESGEEKEFVYQLSMSDGDVDEACWKRHSRRCSSPPLPPGPDPSHLLPW